MFIKHLKKYIIQNIINSWVFKHLFKYDRILLERIKIVKKKILCETNTFASLFRITYNQKLEIVV